LTKRPFFVAVQESRRKRNGPFSSNKAAAAAKAIKLEFAGI
jgi:hypothetical protein